MKFTQPASEMDPASQHKPCLAKVQMYVDHAQCAHIAVATCMGSGLKNLVPYVFELGLLPNFHGFSSFLYIIVMTMAVWYTKKTIYPLVN